MHCGHKGSICHPSYNINNEQKRAWEFFWKGILKYKPFTHLFLNGDAIDGRGVKHSNHQMTTDRATQCSMVCKILNEIKKVNKQPMKYYFTRGTSVHTGQDGDEFENTIAEKFLNDGYNKPIIDDALLVEIDGVKFDLKHHVGRSVLPHGKPSPLMRSGVLKIFAETITGEKAADIFIRSHVHYHVFCEIYGKTMLTTPALQFWSEYGARLCEGIVEFGFIVCDVNKGKVVQWHKYITRTIVKQNVIKG